MLEKIDNYAKKDIIPEKTAITLKDLCSTYLKIIERYNLDKEKSASIINTFIELVKDQCISPFKFQPFHKKITSPFDFYSFGNDFMRMIINEEKSYVTNINEIEQISNQIKQKENVILFSNHQTEADPQIFSILLEKTHPNLAENVIFVAGHRVISDPMAIPFSIGRNLLCIYSKKYIDHPPELRAEKQRYNRTTISTMKKLLVEGGKCIAVFPSGGRDRTNDRDEVEVSPFDSHSIEMFRLTTKQTKVKTHFYPMTIISHKLLPPPQKRNKELGEKRILQRTPVCIHISKEVDIDAYKDNPKLDKHEQRNARTNMIWAQVKQKHDELT